jgi:type IV secretion system protein VirB10
MNTLARQARAREAARLSSAARAQGEMPLPPLTRFDTPGPVQPPSPSGGTSRQEAPAARLPVVPPPLPAAETTATGASAMPAKSPAQLARERLLAGSVFARVSGTQAGGPPPAAPTLQADGPTGQATGLSQLAELLRPTVTAPTRAQLLPTQRFLLPRGAFIDCTLETAIDSSLPGMTSCVTATDTFGADGKVVLLERGTRLAGETRGQVQQGMARVFVLWNEARTPGGVVVPLDSPGADELGRSGLPGEVNRHFWDRFGAAVLVSLLDGGVQAAVQSGNHSGGTVIYDPAASQGVLTESLKGSADIPPTIRKPNGARIQVLVARDVDFRSVYELRSRE